MSSISAKANIVKFRSLDEITHDIPHRSFWDIIKANNSEEIRQSLSSRELEMAKSMQFLDESCTVVSECPKYCDDYCSEQFYVKLAKSLFINDRYISWSTFRYLHPTFFIIETNGNDVHYAFTLFLYLIGIVNDLDKHSFYNHEESTLFVEYTAVGKRVVEIIESEFIKRLEPRAILSISDSFNLTGALLTQTVQLPPIPIN